MTFVTTPINVNTVKRGAVLVCALFLLSSCVREVTRHELKQVQRHDQVYIETLIHQVRIALVAIHDYYQDHSRQQGIPLALDQVVLTVNTSQEDTGEGTVTLFLPTGDAKEDITATNELTLTLTPPSDSQLEKLAGSDEFAQVTQVLRKLKQQTQLQCQQQSGAGHSMPSAGNPQQPGTQQSTTNASADASAQPAQRAELWMSLTQVAVAGLSGYLCAHQRSPQAEMTLTQFEMTIAITAETDDTEGVTFTLGVWSIGSTATEDAKKENTIKLTFKSMDSDGG